MVEFVDYLYGLGLAPATVRMYRSLAKRATLWAQETDTDLLSLKAGDLAELRAQFPESPSTLRQLRCALQHYWDFRGVPYPPVKALRVPKKATPHWRGLSDDDAHALAQASIGWHPQGTAVLCGLYLGLRRAEIAAMRWDRFDSDFTAYTVLGKGGYTDTIPVHSQLRGVLRPLRNGYVYLFPGDGRRIHAHPETIWEWVRRVADDADVEVTPHRLRHTAVNRIYQATGDIRVAQTFARHRRIDTTLIYTEVREDQVRAALDSLDWLPPQAPLRRVQ